jgi:ABC-2 type transport system permease protein
VSIAAPAGARQRLAGYAAYMRVQARLGRTYRADYLLQVVGLLVQVYLLRVVWVAVYGHRQVMAGVSLPEQIAYSSIVTVQAWLIAPSVLWNLTQRVREGTIAMDLLRPVGFLQQVVIGGAGATVARLPFAVAAVPLALLIGRALPPVSALAAVQYALALLIGWVVTCLLGTVVGMLAFWTLEATGALAVYQLVSSFLAGSLAPLWFMPGWLHAVAAVLPFESSSYAPLALYLGHSQGAAAWLLLAEQAGWAVAAWALLKLTWSRAIRRVIIQGG